MNNSSIYEERNFPECSSYDNIDNYVNNSPKVSFVIF